MQHDKSPMYSLEMVRVGHGKGHLATTPPVRTRPVEPRTWHAATLQFNPPLRWARAGEQVTLSRARSLVYGLC